MSEASVVSTITLVMSKKKNKAKQKNRYKQISHKEKILNFAIVITDG